MTTRPAYRKKLIEVDLPLDDINREAAHEKSTSRRGHSSTLHQWWARRPLAACRAVIFASLVDDPASCRDEYPTEELQREQRNKLHDIIRRLVKWENSNDEKLLTAARYEIARSVARTNDESPPNPRDVLAYLRDKAQPIYDPFCGGGSIPAEAQRLGLKAIGSDLNPVAVIITKGLIEISPRFANHSPINPNSDPMGMTVGMGKRKRSLPWRGASGLADDVRYYGRWMREEAYKRIGHLYPKVKLSDGGDSNVIAWLWCRTVPCPNPACGVTMPLVRTFQLSTKTGNRQWARPIVDYGAKTISFVVQTNANGLEVYGTVDRNGARCIACNSAVRLEYVRERSRAGAMGHQMLAIVAKGDRGRVFLSPIDAHIQAALSAKASWRPQQTMPNTPTLVSGRGFGITHWHQLFTERQLTALTTFSDLLLGAREAMSMHGASAEYCDAVCTYLALVIGRMAPGNCSFNRWRNDLHSVEGAFGRQAFPMVWDFAETNVFSDSTQNWMSHVEWVAQVIEHTPVDTNFGEVHQADASNTIHLQRGPVIVTDPPYYDNIDYADLSDFFYVWLRPLLRDIYPDLFAGILSPKSEEMVAIEFRFENPRERFEGLLNKTLQLIRERCTPEFPSSIFYAYKQHEEEREGRTSTGWETMLLALVNAGFEIVGTWPMRTERQNRPNSLGANSLASSVVLVCRPRPADAPTATRRQFLDVLEAELPKALEQLTWEGHIAPVDLAQAAIGPGMQVYSRYSRVETIGGDWYQSGRRWLTSTGLSPSTTSVSRVTWTRRLASAWTGSNRTATTRAVMARRRTWPGPRTCRWKN